MIGKVRATIEILMPLPSDNGSPTVKEFEIALRDAIKRYLWMHITETKVICIRPEVNES